MKYFKMDDFDLRGRTVFVRVDVNSPIDPISGKILDYTRFEAHRQTLQELGRSKVVILAHQSRPGKRDYLSLKPHAEVFTNILKKKVKFVDDLFGKHAQEEIKKMRNGDYILLENTRFYAEEYCLKKNFENTHIVNNLSPLGDYFINDAFAAAHRAQTTLIGFKNAIPMIAGRLMQKEIEMLTKFMVMDMHPKIAILGGAKADDSLAVAENFLNKGVVDKILTGGVVSFFFLLARGYNIGEGSMEYIKKEFENYGEIVDRAKKLIDKYDDMIEIPEDIVVNEKGKRKGMKVDSLPSEYPIYDIGLDTTVKYATMLKDAKAIVVNGPMGVFEISEFEFGTKEVFRAVATSQGFKVAGGGHTIAAIEKWGLKKRFDHISTGGGSLITFLSGGDMPVLSALEESYYEFSKE